MESSLLSRASAFSTSSLFRSQLRGEGGSLGSSGSVRFVAAPRTIGAVGEGGKVVWGRPLLPSLLLENSHAPSLPALLSLRKRKEAALEPCLAAASSPSESSDSAGEAKVAPVGFLDKYPALVTGFFFFMWYFLNVIFNILNKKIYNYFPYP